MATSAVCRKRIGRRDRPNRPFRSDTADTRCLRRKTNFAPQTDGVFRLASSRRVSRYLLLEIGKVAERFLENASVSHSHLPARHLLKQIESDRSRRSKRDRRPAWLAAFVEFVAEQFEPLADVGRVGFDCRLDEEGWSVAMYLGSIELVGGKDDGQTRHLDFRCNLQAVLGRFTRVHQTTFTVLQGDVVSSAEVGSAATTDELGPRSVVMIDGQIVDNRVRLAIYSQPPSAVGPGLRRLPDGRFEPV